MVCEPKLATFYRVFGVLSIYLFKLAVSHQQSAVSKRREFELAPTEEAVANLTFCLKYGKIPIQN